MRIIKGFYRQSALANNNPNIVATFGEIDTQTLTYSVEDRNFKFDDYPNTELVTLQVVDEMQQSVLTSTTLMNQIAAVGEWLYEQHVAGTIPAEGNRNLFYSSLRTEFGNLEFNGMGPLVRSAENAKFMPTYVDFNIMENGVTEYNVKIWLAYSALKEEYEPYRLHIIPPVDDLAQFINNTVTVTGIINGFTPKKLLEKFNAIRGNKPETRFDTYDLTWHDPDDSNSRLTVTFGYVAYGIGATNIDNIKTGIRDYLNANSNYDEWNKIFPSLFEENDFTIIPLWDRIAVPATQLDQNLYASYSRVSDLLEIAANSVPTSYGTQASINSHVIANLEVFSTFYRGMMFMAVANPSNINETKRLSYLYPDYSGIPVSADFERMEEPTRMFAETLSYALEAARTYREGDTLTNSFYRVVRNNKVYVAFLYNSFQYMVMTRESYMTYNVGGVN